MQRKSLHRAARDGDLARVTELVAKTPAAVNADDRHHWRPVFHAALYRHRDVVEFLIDQGADLAAHDGYVMHYAAEVPGNKEVVRLLILYGALEAYVRPPSDEYRQFITAVFLANEARCAAMLRANPGMAALSDGCGDQALHHAARNGDLAIVSLLVEAGANVDAKGRAGHFPLYCAGGHGHIAAVEYLLAKGADTATRFPDGKTLFDWLGQYADNPCYRRVMQVLQEHEEGRRIPKDTDVLP